MVKWCSAGTCKNHHYMRNEDGCAKYSFFKFPSFEKEPDRRAKWARACGRIDPATKKPWEPRNDVQYVYICSEHFITGKLTFYRIILKYNSLRKIGSTSEICHVLPIMSQQFILNVNSFNEGCQYIFLFLLSITVNFL